MELYLLRHGIAESRAASGKDADRRLTPAGVAELRMMLRQASGQGVAPDLILASPYRRALETAEVAVAVLHYPGEILPARALTPDSTPEQVWDEVRMLDARALLLVTHEPLVSSLLAWLIGETRVGPGFPTAAIARVDVEGSGARPVGRLKYLLAPDGLQHS